MERTIYSKYSNERAKSFRIRTDIVLDDAGEKKVYKHALTKEGYAHIARIYESYERLTDAYRMRKITFCPCIKNRGNSMGACVEFPFLGGESLQEVLKCASDAGAMEDVNAILMEYIRRVSEDGGEVPFEVTKRFEEVFGVLSDSERQVLAMAGKNAHTSAVISDVDMILPNFFVNETEDRVDKVVWQVIDYEWTFEFPIPKGFLLYRGLYFAYYQVLVSAGWSLEQLWAMAGITAQEAAVYQKMEEQFQKFLGTGAVPVRNMQRAMGTRSVTLSELMNGTSGVADASDARIPEAEWIHVKKIQFQIDRREYQDGSNICSGWAFAKTWDGRCLPVNIMVTNEAGEPVTAEITRRERADVAEVLKISKVTKPNWGFDCVWIAPKEKQWEIHFSLGKKESVYQQK